MALEKGFELKEHTADVLIVGYGESLEEAFANVARAMFEVMTNTDAVEPKKCFEVTADGMDLYQLLYNWLENLLILKDTEGYVFSKFNVRKIEKVDGGYRLVGEACGEEFSPEKHESRTDVKAVTYHEMDISQVEVDGKKVWKVQLVVDI